MALQSILDDFSRAIVQANRLVASAHAQDGTGRYLWHSDDRMLVTEAAFLKLFVAWESFLEAAFLDYLMGTASIRGTIIPCHASPPNVMHANDMLRGLKPFVDWSNPDEVKRLGNLFLDQGEPFKSVLNSVFSDIIDMKTIRNATAHLTSTTATKLDTVATRKLGRPCSNMSVYAFITSIDPAASPPKTILQTYIEQLDAAAFNIGHF